MRKHLIAMPELSELIDNFEKSQENLFVDKATKHHDQYPNLQKKFKSDC